jgi:hypothetical protein
MEDTIMSARDVVIKLEVMKTSRVVARMLGGMLFISGGILLNSDGYRATADEFLRGADKPCRSTLRWIGVAMYPG